MNSRPASRSAGQADEEVGDLGLRRGVERRHGLVGDDDLGVGRQGPGDGDALALAAGELERVARRDRPVEPDLFEQPGRRRRSRPDRPPAGAQPVGDLAADASARVERGVGVLEHHLDPPQPWSAEHRSPSGVTSVPWNDTVPTPAAGARRRPGERRLAAAGLADEADDLTGVDVEVDVDHGVHRSPCLRG